MPVGEMCDVENVQSLRCCLTLHIVYDHDIHGFFFSIHGFFFSKMSWEKILWTYTLSAQLIYISCFVFRIFSNFKRSVDSELNLCHLLSNVRLTKMCRSAFWLPFWSVGVFFTRPNSFNAVSLLIHKMHF